MATQDKEMKEANEREVYVEGDEEDDDDDIINKEDTEGESEAVQEDDVESVDTEDEDYVVGPAGVNTPKRRPGSFAAQLSPFSG